MHKLSFLLLVLFVIGPMSVIGQEKVGEGERVASVQVDVLIEKKAPSFNYANLKPGKYRDTLEGFAFGVRKIELQFVHSDTGKQLFSLTRAIRVQNDIPTILRGRGPHSVKGKLKADLMEALDEQSKLFLLGLKDGLLSGDLSSIRLSKPSRKQAVSEE